MFYKHIAKPLVFKKNAEQAHDLALKLSHVTLPFTGILKDHIVFGAEVLIV
jgi:hypothetical protein